MDTRVKHEYDNKVGVILGHTFFIVILGLVPRIHLKPLDTRDKPEYDRKEKLHKYDREENLPEYDNSDDWFKSFFLIL